MMGLCPICGRYYCDHTNAERGQTDEEMLRLPSDEEKAATMSGDQKSIIRAAKKHLHDK